MTFNLINRRVHLYLSLCLLPWFFVYGLSSIPITHNLREWFDDGNPQWITRFDREYSLPVPKGVDLKRIGAQILKDAGLKGTFGINRRNGKLNINQVRFTSRTRLTYFIQEDRLLAEDRRFRWDQFLIGIHVRGGFHHDSFLYDAWAVVVDIVQIGILIWIASGIYMWWLLSQTRRWGFVALGSGLLSFFIFILAL